MTRLTSTTALDQSPEAFHQLPEWIRNYYEPDAASNQYHQALPRKVHPTPTHRAERANGKQAVHRWRPDTCAQRSLPSDFRDLPTLSAKPGNSLSVL